MDGELRKELTIPLFAGVEAPGTLSSKSPDLVIAVAKVSADR
jgi:hypothetical protein